MVITELDVLDFTTGACFLLAKAVQSKSGWPAAAFWDGFRATGHAFNAMPDGRYLDVRGAHTRHDMMLSRWGHDRGRHGITTRHVRLHEWELCWDDHEKYEARAVEIAAELLSRYALVLA